MLIHGDIETKLLLKDLEESGHLVDFERGEECTWLPACATITLSPVGNLVESNSNEIAVSLKILKTTISVAGLRF